jgi:integrase/recombinase XerD
MIASSIGFDLEAPTSLRFRVRLDTVDLHLGASLEAAGLEWSPDMHCYLWEAEPTTADRVIAAIDAMAQQLDDLASAASVDAGTQLSVAGTFTTQGHHSDPALPKAGQAVGAGASEGGPLTDVQMGVLKRFEECVAKHGYSIKTLKSYKNAFRSFLWAVGPRMPIDLSKAEVEDWLAMRLSTHAHSTAHQNTLINALKFYYVSVEGRPSGGYVFERPRARTLEPTSLSKGEVQRIVANTINIKHRCILLLTYSTGLRLKEVLSLRVGDIDFVKNVIIVQPAAGKRPDPSPTRTISARQGANARREMPLSPKLAAALKVYLEECDPHIWLFEGERAGVAYSERSAQMVVKLAAKRAGLDREVSIQMLRNSYATHQLEAGIAVQALQDLMGHGSIRTTGRYAHVARHRAPASPADDLDL